MMSDYQPPKMTVYVEHDPERDGILVFMSVIVNGMRHRRADKMDRVCYLTQPPNPMLAPHDIPVKEFYRDLRAYYEIGDL